jgi:hypothetical protein
MYIYVATFDSEGVEDKQERENKHSSYGLNQSNADYAQWKSTFLFLYCGVKDVKYCANQNYHERVEHIHINGGEVAHQWNVPQNNYV